MLTIKKRGLLLLSVIIASSLTACGPAGPRALVKGERLMASKKIAEAIPKFTEATKLLAKDSPENQAQAWNWLGLALYQNGQPKEAMDAFVHALALDRNLSSADYNLGYLQFDQRNYPAAIDAWNTYLVLKPKDAEGKEAEILLQIGTAHLRQSAYFSGPEKNRQLDQARKYLESSLRIAQDAEALNNLGLVILQRNRSPIDAVTKFRQALQVRPGFAPALLNLAIVHHQYLNDHRSALQEYQSYLALRPAPADSKEIEAVVAVLARELAPQAARQPVASPALAKPTAVVPTPAPAPPAVTETVEKPTPSAKTPTTAPEMAPAASKSPTNAPKSSVSDDSTGSRYNYPTFSQSTPGNREEAARLTSQGQQSKQKNNIPAAIESYRGAIKADPTYFDAYYYLSTAQRDNGEVTAALDSLSHALMLRPESVETRYAFAWLLEKSKYPQDAVVELEKLLKQSPTDARAHLLTANIYVQELHQPAQARPHYQKVLEIEPHHAQAGIIKAWLSANP